MNSVGLSVTFAGGEGYFNFGPCKAITVETRLYYEMTDWRLPGRIIASSSSLDAFITRD